MTGRRKAVSDLKRELILDGARKVFVEGDAIILALLEHKAEASLAVTFVWVAVLLLLELAGPVLAERLHGGTPWHAHHIAERYGLLTIIALGEGVVGTVAALSASVQEQGWTLDAALVGLAGTGRTFGM